MATNVENQGMLRSAGLRAVRSGHDSEDADYRRASTVDVSQRVGRGTGEQKVFYKDLGFSMTPSQYSAYQQNEKTYQDTISDRQAEIDAAQATYDTALDTYSSDEARLKKAQKSMPSLKEAVDTSWNSYKKNMTQVRVVNSRDEIEATYYIPREATSSLVGQRGIFASREGNTMNVMVKGDRNQELHDALRNGARDIESDYRTTASKQLSKELINASGQITEAAGVMATSKGQLGEYKGTIDTANTDIETANAARELQLQQLRDSYNERKAAVQEIFGGTLIESPN